RRGADLPHQLLASTPSLLAPPAPAAAGFPLFPHSPPASSQPRVLSCLPDSSVPGTRREEIERQRQATVVVSHQWLFSNHQRQPRTCFATIRNRQNRPPDR